MLLNTSLLFELPIYRIDKETYYNEFNAFTEKNKMEYMPIGSPFYLDLFGGQWEYNEIIAYMKFYVSGKTQIRVEYHETNKKKKYKTRKKVFIKHNQSFCTRNISHTLSNEQIIELLEECIQHCRTRLPSKRYLKTDFFDVTFKYTNWREIIFK